MVQPRKLVLQPPAHRSSAFWSVQLVSFFKLASTQALHAAGLFWCHTGQTALICLSHPVPPPSDTAVLLYHCDTTVMLRWWYAATAARPAMAKARTKAGRIIYFHSVPQTSIF